MRRIACTQDTRRRAGAPETTDKGHSDEDIGRSSEGAYAFSRFLRGCVSWHLPVLFVISLPVKRSPRTTAGLCSEGCAHLPHFSN